MEPFFIGQTDDLSAICRNAVVYGDLQTEVFRKVAEGGKKQDRNKRSLSSSRYYMYCKHNMTIRLNYIPQSSSLSDCNNHFYLALVCMNSSPLPPVKLRAVKHPVLEENKPKASNLNAATLGLLPSKGQEWFNGWMDGGLLVSLTICL